MNILCCNNAVLINQNEIVEGRKRNTYVCKECKKVIYLYDRPKNTNGEFHIKNHSTR